MYLQKGEVLCRTYVRLIPHVELHFCCNSGEIVVKYACLPSCCELDEKIDTTQTCRVNTKLQQGAGYFSLTYRVR